MVVHRERSILGKDCHVNIKSLFPRIVHFDSKLFAIARGGMNKVDGLRVFSFDTGGGDVDWQEFAKLPQDFNLDENNFSMSIDTKKALLHIIGCNGTEGKYGILDLNDGKWTENIIKNAKLLTKGKQHAIDSCVDQISGLFNIVANKKHYRVDEIGRKHKTYKLTANHRD